MMMTWLLGIAMEMVPIIDITRREKMDGVTPPLCHVMGLPPRGNRSLPEKQHRKSMVMIMQRLLMMMVTDLIYG